jgi:hypothetical protein
MLSYTESENANIHTVKIDYSTANVTVVFGDTLKIDYPQQIRKDGKEKTTISLTENDGVLSLDEDTLKGQLNP